MLDLFNYSFILRGLEAGLIIALVAPLIGIFLVLRRYSLIADTLSHVSLAGVAIGLLLNVNPLVTAIITSALASIGIERLRLSQKIYGESALALFLSGSLAVAIILIKLANGFTVDLFSYLFGSLVTVQTSDVMTIFISGLVVTITIFLFYKELIFVTFDEDAAQVSGLPVKFLNILLIVLASLTVALAIPIIGVLLVSALIVIPVMSALQFGLGFNKTLFLAETISVLSVITGMIVSYYLDLPTGAVIVALNVLAFFISYASTK
jgi:zinc transport system permease protein